MNWIADSNTWLDVSVAIAQIGAALGTLAAVWCALHVARRGESQRLQISMMPIHTFKQSGFFTTSLARLDLRLTVANAGVVPVEIEDIQLIVPVYNKMHRDEIYLLQFQGGDGKTIRLSHSDVVRIDQPIIGQSSNVWRLLPHVNWKSARPRYVATTTLGIKFEQVVPRSTWRTIRKSIARICADNPVTPVDFFLRKETAKLVEGHNHVRGLTTPPSPTVPT